jgi:anaerobic glycerol-3-phosphate dehydrogenase C subunit
MDPQRTRIQEDLRGLIAGDVRCDDVYVQLYACDASIYEIKPLGVVLPRGTEDLVACVKYAAENNLPLHARGAGSGIAGQCLGPGLVIDFARHFRRILHTGPDTVRVQPGVVHERLNQHLRQFGRQFGPDPTLSGVTTLGGCIAVDSGGSHWLKHGSVRRHVVSLQVVLADGSVMELGNEPVSSVTKVPTDVDAELPSRKEDLLASLAVLLRREQKLIQKHQPKTLVNTCGYHLDVLQGGHLDAARLLAGSEGTLALITEATLATQMLPKHRAVALLFFDQLDKAARGALEVVPLGASACDLMDRRHLSLARETKPQFQPIIPPSAEAMLLIEAEGEDAAEVHERLREIVERVWHKKKLAFGSSLAFSREEVELYWQLALKVVPTLHRLKGSTRALPFVEDLAVPPETLPRFLIRLQNVLKLHQVTASLFGHAGHGQLHVRPFLDLGTPDDVHRLHRLASDVYEAVWEIGGTISGEHGDGLSRTAFVPRQYGALYPVFQEVKRLFDSANLLNPGKIVGGDEELVTRNLRPVLLAQPPTQTQVGANGESSRHALNGNGSANVAPPASDQANALADLPGRGKSTEGTEPDEAPQLIELQLNWTPPEITHMARTCNGCGACRTQSAGSRMCPIFRFAPAEEASPRAKANLLRGVLTGQLDHATLASDEFRAVADLCVNCQMCRLECPANVDIPKLMIEAKAAHVRAKGMSFSDWLLTRIDILGELGTRWYLRPFFNWAISHRSSRWMIEKALGIAQGRKLPRFASGAFLRRARRRRLSRPSRRSGRKVVFFLDNYVNYYDPQLGDALVAVLEHNGVSVYVPEEQRQSGMTMIALGSLDQARKLAARNLALLADAVRQGYHVVTTEPSAAMCLTREYLMLIDDDDSRLVAENSSEACTYLWRMHQAGNLQLDFKPVNASLAYHMPCHLKALEVGSPGLNLLKLVPGLSVRMTQDGCSGMAGTFGLKRENYRSSLRAGWGVISSLRQTDFQAGSTECSACKMQMEQGTTKPTIHPLKLLALAYGLMPELTALLSQRGEDLIVT